MHAYILPFLIGLFTGLRSLTTPAAVSWGAAWGMLHLENTWLAFLGYKWTPYILTLLAIGELIADKLPSTPSRKAALGLSARVTTGALCGAAIGVNCGNLNGGLVVGVVGAIVGTFAGYECRVRLVRATGGKDLPIALLEDAVAIAGAAFVVSRFG